ncbi:MAG TPA: amidase [Chloroflexaceae bacterium]|nr:amidase [Chloroflexaceae bacterium]
MARQGRLSRRGFLRASVAGAAGLTAAAGAAAGAAAAGMDTSRIGANVYEASIAQLQAAMGAGRLSAREVTRAYLERIDRLDQKGPGVRSVLEVNPEALAIADSLDAERRAGRVRGPLHGIPILLKDNIDTDDRTLTTAGSLALVGSRPAQDATVARKLREAGAILLGKTNLSEWANFRSTQSSSGWSGRGRQTRNPYALDRNPCGSSSGSAAAVAASLCAAALGTETDGSIVCPSSLCGVVGLKPTVGLTSRAGVIPIAETQDTVGPHARSVADAAIVLGAIAGPDPRDPATAASARRLAADYTAFLDRGGLRGARIGVLRNPGTVGYSPEADAIFDGAVGTLRGLGAVVIDPLPIPDEVVGFVPEELTVLLYEFKDNLNRYLATRVANPAFPREPLLRTLEQLIAFNQAVREVEMPYFGQEIFELAQATGGLEDPAYRQALAVSRDGARAGIDKAFADNRLDAIVALTGQPAWPTDLISGDHFLGASSAGAARAGYPLLSLPAGYAFGLPVGITFMGTAYSEPALIRLAYAFEQATNLRRPPQYHPTLPLP